jgi:hypothetical protein
MNLSRDSGGEFYGYRTLSSAQLDGSSAGVGSLRSLGKTVGWERAPEPWEADLATGRAMKLLRLERLAANDPNRIHRWPTASRRCYFEIRTMGSAKTTPRVVAPGSTRSFWKTPSPTTPRAVRLVAATGSTGSRGRLRPAIPRSSTRPFPRPRSAEMPDGFGGSQAPPSNHQTPPKSISSSPGTDAVGRSISSSIRFPNLRAPPVPTRPPRGRVSHPRPNRGRPGRVPAQLL